MSRAWGIGFLSSAALLGTVYATVVGVLSVMDATGLVQRIQAMIYMSGLFVVPVTLVLVIAGSTILLRRKS